MKYDKQYLGELSLVDRLKHHKAYQQRFTKEDAPLSKVRDVWIVERRFVKPDNSMVGNNRFSNWKTTFLNGTTLCIIKILKLLMNA